MTESCAKTPIQEDPWLEQWKMFEGNEHQTETLFWEWVTPLDKEAFAGKKVLDGGCGAGHMLSYLEPYISEGVGIDLNTSTIAEKRFQHSPKIRISSGDISVWQEENQFDIVYSIGVVHHSENPKKSAQNLLTLVKKGGYLSLWVYGWEGNFWARWLVEKPKRLLFSWMPRKFLWRMSQGITALMYPVVYSIYLLPMPVLPYYEYFRSWRRLRFKRNATNVFDKLNAPRTNFIRRSEIDDWFVDQDVQEVSIRPWCGISWRVLVKK